MTLLKIEAWTVDAWSGKRYKFAEVIRTDKEPYKSMQIYYDVSGAVVAAHPQESLTIDDCVEVLAESNYEIVIKEMQLDDGRIIYQHMRSYGEPEARRADI